MKTYIALLRGINVGGQKKIKMADLRQALEKTGFLDVTTYIQSGNIIFNDEKEDITALSDKISKTILDSFGFNVPVLVKTAKEIKDILNQNPFVEDELNVNYYILLKNIPDATLVETLGKEDYPDEAIAITNSCVYLHSLKGYRNAKFSNNYIERKLKVSATARNQRTMQKLLALSQN